MTSLGRSPPGSEKESYDALEPPTPLVEPVTTPSRAVGPEELGRQTVDTEAPVEVTGPEPGGSSDEAGRTREEKRAVRRARAEARAAAKASRRSQDDDHIVEAPRGPKVSLAERWRVSSAARARAAADKKVSPDNKVSPGRKGRGKTSGGSGGGKRVVAALAAGIGVLGLVCSVVLAVGALLVALGANKGNAVYDVVSPLCDLLVGPLRDVFSFEGTSADMKESLVAWGLGSMGYLAVGLSAQSFLRARIGD